VPPFLLVFNFAGRQLLPLHVAGVVRAAGAQRDDVIDHVAGAFAARLAGGWAGVASGESAAL